MKRVLVEECDVMDLFFLVHSEPELWEQQLWLSEWLHGEEREYDLLHVGVQPDGLLHRFVPLSLSREGGV